MIPILYVLFSLGSFASAQQLGDFVFSDVPSIEQRSIDSSLAYQIYLLHIQIGEHSISNSPSLLQEDALVLLNSLRELSQYSVITAMQHSQNKTEVFEAYIHAMESTLYASNAIQSQLQSEINTISSDVDVCSRQQKRSQNAYQEAIGSSSSTRDLDPIVISSQTSASCIGSNSSLLSAKQELLNALLDASNRVGNRYDYLSSQKDIILNHFDLLGTKDLQNIIDIQENIQDQNY